jgi:EthD domain
MSTTRPLMGKLFDPQFANIADYDCIVQIQFKDVEDFVKLKADPLYREAIMQDHERFADTKRST